MSEDLRFGINEEEILRECVYVVLQNHTIWKKVFFKTREQAANVIKMFNRHDEFKKDGDSLVGKKSGKRFTIYSVQEYTKMDDIKLFREY